MNILITGGSGYVGGRVVQHLQKNAAFAVTVGSRRRAPLAQKNYATINWESAESLATACAGQHTVLHFAGMNEIDCAANPVAALTSNGVNTVRLIEAAKLAGVKRFMYLSTAHVYGSPLVGRMDEHTAPRPVHPYATSKRAAEDAVLTAHYGRSFESLVIRMSNSFGAPVDPGVDRWTLLVNDLCKQAVHEKQLILKSHGAQRRDFIALSDVTNAIEHFLRLDWRAQELPLFNLGGAWAPTVYEVAEIIAKQCSVLFGYLPKIIRPEKLATDIDRPLDYSVEKLLATGFKLSGQAEAEISDTLLLQASMS
jgi:UDP-glucose 4-epimerase